MNINFNCSTDGKGRWSTCQRSVRCIKLKPDAHVYDNDPIEEETGELRVEFDDSWDVASHGLIYTDKLFIAEFREQLAKLGFNVAACKDVHLQRTRYARPSLHFV